MTTPMTTAAPFQLTRKWIWRLLTFFVGILIVIKIFSEIDWQLFLANVARLSPTSVLSVAIIYLLLNLFRCLRFKALINRDEVRLPRLFWISLYHNFLVRILPFKLGEVWYVVLTRRYFQLPIEEGVGTLFASRMLELLVIVLIGTAALFTSGTVLAGQGALQALFIIIFFGAGIPGLYFAGLILRRVAAVLRWTSIPLMSKVAQGVDKMAREFDRLRHPRIFLGGLFWSLFTYACSFATNAILLTTTGVQLPFASLILAVTLGMFASAFPFNVAGFGMVELSWAFILPVLAGMTHSEAVGVGLLLNGFQIITSIVYGVIAYGVLKFMDYVIREEHILTDTLALKRPLSDKKVQPLPKEIM